MTEMSAFVRILTVSWAYGELVAKIYFDREKMQIIHLNSKILG